MWPLYLESLGMVTNVSLAFGAMLMGDINGMSATALLL